MSGWLWTAAQRPSGKLLSHVKSLTYPSYSCTKVHLRWHEKVMEARLRYNLEKQGSVYSVQRLPWPKAPERMGLCVCIRQETLETTHHML